MKLIQLDKIKGMAMLLILISTINRNIYADESGKKYTLSKISFIGNVRIPERKIRELMTLKEGARLTLNELDFQIKVSKSKMAESKLFIFMDMNYEVHEDDTCDINISIGESVIFIDMSALEQGSFTRFSSITENAPDFGFWVGSKAQALYLRFPYFLKTPANLSTTITHYAYKIPFNSENMYDYEAASARAALDTIILPNWKIKVPAMYRYNIKKQPQTLASSDFSTGVETILDFSHYKDVIYTGFDIHGGMYQGLVIPYTMSSAGINVYFKPLKWDELVLRGRYNTVIEGKHLPEYLLYRIDNEYQVRGQILRHYYGRKSAIINIENWIYNIVVIPSAITNINFNVLTFVDMGMASDQITAIHRDTWNLSVGGAIVVDFTSPLNISIQAGYGHEIWQNTGGQFYVKLGYEFRKGNFFE